MQWWGSFLYKARCDFLRKKRHQGESLAGTEESSIRDGVCATGQTGGYSPSIVRYDPYDPRHRSRYKPDFQSEEIVQQLTQAVMSACHRAVRSLARSANGSASLDHMDQREHNAFLERNSYDLRPRLCRP